MSIKGLSQIRRLPRVGIIRLGVKAKSAKGTEYPKAVDYFVCPEEVQKVYGEKPKELDIVIPLDSVENIFPQFYKRYGHSKGLVCKGDGETASQVNEKTGEFEEIECLGQKCPNYQAKKCKEVATLNFILPKIQLDGIYQLHTSSFHSIVKINSSLDYIRSMFGKIQMLPLKLIVEGTEAHPDKKMKKIVYTLRIAFNAGEIMKSIQKREGLLEHAANSVMIAETGKINKDDLKPGQTIKVNSPGQVKVELPSSDENPIEDPPIEETKNVEADTIETEKVETSTIDNPPKQQGETAKQVSTDDEEEVALCDVCETALNDKELESCKYGFKEKGQLKYKFLCGACQQELGYIKK